VRKIKREWMINRENEKKEVGHRVGCKRKKYGKEKWRR
jgi:hypothetical protein